MDLISALLDHSIQVVGMILAAGVIYGGIRGDIKNIHQKIYDNKEEANEKISEVRTSVNEAHHRIDGILDRRQP